MGIDLGTTHSLVAVCDAAGPRIIPDAAGAALLPSVVRYETAADEPRGYRAVVGAPAREHAAEFPQRTISSIKRLMGRSAREAAADSVYTGHAVAAGERDTARVRLTLDDGRGVTLSPEEVSAEILARLKTQASAALGVDVIRAVVTVPAYFDDAQRQATRTAGRLAGLEVVRIVPEPTAAALAYGLGLPDARRTRPMTIAVYDLGGGTFDISVLRLTPAQEPGETFFFEVLATGGDTHLGGDDIDHLLVDLFTREIAAIPGRGDGPLDAVQRRVLLAAAEAAKKTLSDVDTTQVDVPLEDRSRYVRRLDRAELETLVTPLIERTLDISAGVLRRALAAAAALGDSSIDAVIMVGGSTRIPRVRARVGTLFGLEPYTALNPDEVVALGAGVQAAVLSGTRTGTLLLDVIPLSLGIETVGGAVAKIVTANSTLPARATEMFSTSVDGQTSIRLSVFQGEREMAADCRRLGEFHLRGLPPMPAGIPQLEVQFLVDANGVLNVSALERRSGKRAALQVIPNHGLTDEEVQRIERDSVLHARADMTRHRIVDLIVNSRLDLKWVREGLARLRGDLDPAYAAELEGNAARLAALIDRAHADWTSVDANELQHAKEELDRASVRMQELSITRSLRGENINHENTETPRPEEKR